MCATGEFIVAAGRTEDGDIREVDLEMEIGAIADASRVRKMDSVKIYYLVDSYPPGTSGTRLNLFNDSCWFRGAVKHSRPG